MCFTVIRSASRRAGILLTGAALSLGAIACGGGASTGSRTYTMQGQVLSVAPERKETVVRHEEIVGFMPAMTMPYYVRDPQQLSGLKPGDLITSTLIVEDSGTAYLEKVTKVGDAPLERPGAAAPSATSGFELVREGEAAPDANFIDQDGQTRRLSSFKGSRTVLTFVYTKCPLPTFCPLMDRNFAVIQTMLAGRPAMADVRLVSVSFDPITDTPAVLARHAAALAADRSRWTFLTGDRDEVDQFAARFGVSVMRAPNDQTDITHNLRTAIIDAAGTVAKIYTGNDWTPEQLVNDLATTVGHPR